MSHIPACLTDTTSWYITASICGVLVALWPIGIPVLLFVAMYRARNKIKAGDEDTVRHAQIRELSSHATSHSVLVASSSSGISRSVTTTLTTGIGRWW